MIYKQATCFYLLSNKKTPNEIPLYSYITALLTLCQRSIPLQQMETGTETQIGQISQRDLNTLNPKWDLSIQSLPLALGEFCRKGGRKSVRARRNAGHEGSKTF